MDDDDFKTIKLEHLVALKQTKKELISLIKVLEENTDIDDMVLYLFEADFIITACGIGGRAYHRCMNAHNNGERLDPQEAILDEAIILKNSAIKDDGGNGWKGH